MTSATPWGGNLVKGEAYLLRGRTRCVLLEATDVTARVQMDDGGIWTVDRTDLSELSPALARSTPRAGTRPPAVVSADPEAAVSQVTAPIEDLHCPECLAAGVEHEPYASGMARGRHRWNLHGVESPHRAARRAAAERRAPLAAAPVVPVSPPDPEDHQCVWRERYHGALEALRAQRGGK
jgi:hypothetical protein